MPQSDHDMTIEMHANILHIKEKLDCHIAECVTQKEFVPLRNGFYGLVGTVILGIVYTALGAIGIKPPNS